MSTLPENYPTKPAGRRLLTVKQVQALCGVGRRTVYHWMRENRVEWCDGLTRRYVYADSIPLFSDLLETRRVEE